MPTAKKKNLDLGWFFLNCMPQEFLFFFQLPKWYLLCFNFVILIAYNLTPFLVFQCLRPLQCSCKMVLFFFACVDGIQYSLLVTRWYRRPISYVKKLKFVQCQVRMDFASAISVSRKQCFIAGTPLWHLVRICMFVLYILLIC